jgi:hypothetical protein
MLPGGQRMIGGAGEILKSHGCSFRAMASGSSRMIGKGGEPSFR